MTKKGILIVGHGSRYEYNRKVMEMQVRRLRDMGFGNVYMGFDETSHPLIGDSLLQMAEDGVDEIIAIPFFVASGVHVTRTISEKLGAKAGESADITVGGRRMRVHYGHPFGEDPLLARILGEKVFFLDSGKGVTGVMVMGHGSRLPYNEQIIRLNAERLTAMSIPNVYYAFNEFNLPTIEDTVERMLADGVTEIIALPLFISSGDHLKNDIPEKIRLRDGMSQGTFDHDGRTVTVRYASPIGEDPRLTELFAEKAKKFL